MDRTLVYAGQVPRALDNLLLGRFAMVGLAKLAEAVLGTNTAVPAGSFSVTPGGGLNISVGPGQIYQLQSIEPTTESALNVDGHQVLKQGVALDAQTLTLVPPAANGYAQNFLVQVAYADVPTGQTVLSFQNPTPVLDPSTNTYKYVTYPGPGGNGAQSYTILQGGVNVIAKPGTAAPSGSQTTPSPDAGYVGLYVITLAFGATSISTGNISQYASAPFIPVTLPGVPAGVQSGTWSFGQDIGTADNYVINLSPNTGSIAVNQRIFVKFSAANATTSPVINANGTGNKSLLLRNGSAPAKGDVPAGWRSIFFDGSAFRLEGAAASELVVAGSGAVAQSPVGRGLRSFTTAGAGTWKVPSVAAGDAYDVYWVLASCIGGGAGGSGAANSGVSTGGGGGAGGTATGWMAVTPGQVIPYVVGAGSPGAAYQQLTSNGGTSSIGSTLTATGGQGTTNSGISGGQGGTGSGGQVNLVGGAGGDGIGSGGNLFTPTAMGGASSLGGGGRAALAPGSPTNGRAPGSGGGGLYGNTSANAGSGGNGADGSVSFQY